MNKTLGLKTSCCSSAVSQFYFKEIIDQIHETPRRSKCDTRRLQEAVKPKINNSPTATSPNKHCRSLFMCRSILCPLMSSYYDVYTKLQLDMWCQHKTASAYRAVVPLAVHQRGGATAMADVSSFVPVVNNICKRKSY